MQQLCPIITRLPAKSLARFKSVSKNWNSTISKPAFTRLHHSLAHTRSDGGILAINFTLLHEKTSEDFFFTAPYQGGPAVDHPDVGGRYFNVSTSTNGLVLLCCKNKFRPNQSVIIYNPATKEEDCLPNVRNYVNYYCSNELAEFYSLGYDPFTGQYKVLAMCTLTYYYDNDGNLKVDIEEEEGWYEAYCLMIFALGTESWTWRRLDLDFPMPYRIVFPSSSHDDHCCVSGCCANGALHWLVRRIDGDGKITNGYEYILAFDVGKEKFRKLPLPRELASSNNIMVSEVGDRVALTRNKLGDNGVPEVWVYEKGEWMKMKIEVPLPWKIRKNRICEVRSICGGEKLLVIPHRQTMTEQLRVYYYDNTRKKWSKVRLTALPADYNYDSAYSLPIVKVVYEVSNNVETLFSPRACVDWDKVYCFFTPSSVS